MANHVSALKRARQTVTRTEVNRANRSRVRTSLRALRGSHQGRRQGRSDAVSRDRLHSRQGRAEGYPSPQYRLPLQEPAQCAAEGPGHRQGVAPRSRQGSKTDRITRTAGVHPRLFVFLGVKNSPNRRINPAARRFPPLPCLRQRTSSPSRSGPFAAASR